MSDELAVLQQETPNHLIALALDRQADPAVLSELMDLQERWEAGNARKAFVSAMTLFKQEAPSVLKKNDKVDFTSPRGRTAYSYANLGSIVQEITSVLGKYELSATWETKQDDKGNITVTCNITHAAGHRESVTLTGPADESGNKNKIQAIGSTVTYLQRYTLLAALGLATTEDDDGRGEGKSTERPPIAEPQTKKSPAQTEKSESNAPASGNIIEGLIQSVKESSGTKKSGEKWIRFAILIADQTLSTFSKTDGEKAQIAFENQTLVRLTYTSDGKYLTCTGIEEIIGSTEENREPGAEG